MVALIALVAVTTSCSLDDGEDFYFEPVKIISATFPEEMNVGTTYTVEVVYEQTSTCHVFNGFNYLPGENLTRTVTALSTVYPERLCEDSELEREAAFQFKPAESGTYVFRFWQGEDQYLEIEAIVGGAN